MMVLNLEHKTVAGKDAPEYDVYFGEWFKDGGYERALACTDADEAKKILADTFKGPDTEGITLAWNPIYYPD